MSDLAIRRRSKTFGNRLVWRKAVQGARRDGTSLEAEISRVISRYANMADGDYDRSLTPSPTDTVLRTDADWDAFAREMGLDD